MGEEKRGRGDQSPLTGDNLRVAEALAEVCSADLRKLPDADRERLSEVLARVAAGLPQAGTAAEGSTLKRHTDVMWEDIAQQNLQRGGYDLLPWQKFMLAEVAKRSAPRASFAVIPGNATAPAVTVRVCADSRDLVSDDGAREIVGDGSPFEFIGADGVLDMEQVENLRGGHPAIIVAQLIVASRYWPWAVCTRNDCRKVFVPNKPKDIMCSVRCKNRATHERRKLHPEYHAKARAKAKAYYERKKAKASGGKKKRTTTKRKTTKTNTGGNK